MKTLVRQAEAGALVVEKRQLVAARRSAEAVTAAEAVPQVVDRLPVVGRQLAVAVLVWAVAQQSQAAVQRPWVAAPAVPAVEQWGVEAVPASPGEAPARPVVVRL